MLQPVLERFRTVLLRKNVAQEIAVALCNSVASSLEGKKVGTFACPWHPAQINCCKQNVKSRVRCALCFCGTKVGDGKERMRVCSGFDFFPFLCLGLWQ